MKECGLLADQGIQGVKGFAFRYVALKRDPYSVQGKLSRNMGLHQIWFPNPPRVCPILHMEGRSGMPTRGLAREASTKSYLGAWV